MSPDDAAVREANQAFYRAFESLSLERMEEVWAHDGQILCIHPGWPLAEGWDAVRASWLVIFRNTRRIRFQVSGERVSVAGDLAWVVCVERLESVSADAVDAGGLLATNVFHRRGGRWQLVHHHASPFAGDLSDEPGPPDDGGGGDATSGGRVLN